MNEPTAHRIKINTIKSLASIRNHLFLFLICSCFFSSVLYGQEQGNTTEQMTRMSDTALHSNTDAVKAPKNQNENQLKAKLYLIETGSVRVDKKLPVLPVEVGVSDGKARSVKIDVLKIVSRRNNIIPVQYTIAPSKSDILPDQTGKVFNVTFDTAAIDTLEPGAYTAFISITSESADPRVEKYSFEIVSSRAFLNPVSTVIKNVRDNFIGVVWNVFEMIFFIFLIGLIIWFLRLALKGRHSLSVLSIVNKTGRTEELEGVASGIDDLLMSRLQDIKQKSSIAQVKHYWLSPSSITGERKETLTAQAQLLNVMGGGVPMDLQKLGDISVGPVKIPFGAITAFLTKTFGGNYVSGAIQKYGKVNKIVLKLEARPSFFQRNMDMRYFEVTWPSEAIRIEDISEGVPSVIDELAYRITLNLAKEIGTQNWNAYKYFLEGILAFRDYEENRTRKDRLRDSIDLWRESVRLDPNFAKAHYNLGVALDIDGKYEDAIFRYQKVIHMSPELAGAEAHYNLAKLYWDIYKAEEQTLEELKKAKALDPDLSDVYNLEGLVYSKRWEDRKAADSYGEAIRRSKGDPNPVFYYNLSVAEFYLEDYDAAESAGEKAITLYGDKEKVKGLLQTMGLIQIKKGKYGKALNYLEEGLMKEPENRAMLDGYGEVLRESGYSEQALLIQRRLIRLYPEYGRGYAEMARTLGSLEKPEDEVMSYEKIGSALSDKGILEVLRTYDIRKFQEDFAAAFDLKNAPLVQQKIFAGVMGGISYYYFAKYNDAAKFFENMLQNELKDIEYLLKPEALHTYGIVLKKLGEQSDKERRFDLSFISYDLAAKTLRDAVRLYDEEQIYDLAQCYSDLAESYSKSNLHDQADKAYKKAIDYYKKEKLFHLASDTHVKDAECLMDWFWKGGSPYNYEWARIECNEAIRLDNSNHGAFHVKGTTYYDFRRYAEAIPQYEKAVEINYDLKGAHYNLGLCYMNLGKYEEAANKFETTIKLDQMYADPNNENNPDPYKQVSICLEKLGRLDRAVETLRRVADMFPLSIKYHLLLGQFLVKCTLLDEASKQFKFCLDFDKGNTQNLKHLSLNSMADLYAEQGADIDKAYKMSRSALIICKPLIKEIQEKGKKVKSRVISDEDLSSIRNTLGYIHYQKGQIKKAVVFLEKSLVHALGDPKSHARLAQAYEKYAETCSYALKVAYREKAKTQWRIVLDLDTQGTWSKIADEHLDVLTNPAVTNKGK